MQTIDLDILAERLLEQATDRRVLVAIAGAPGSGKSLSQKAWQRITGWKTEPKG